MALSLGTLFVKLSADPSQLTKGMNEAADKVAKFGNKMNEISGKLGAVGVSLTALGAGALRLAGQFDANVKRATDDLANSFNHIMVEIAQALLPTVRALSSAMATLANWFKSLSPETKQAVAGFAATAAGILTMTAGVGKLVAAFTSLAPVITGALTPIMPVLLPIIGVIAALVAVVPLLWQAWKSNFGNVQGYTGAVIDYIADKWKAFKEYFGGVINFIGKAWNNLVGFLFRVWAAQMKSIATVAAKVAKVFGADWSRELDAFNETIDDIASRGFTGLVDDAASSMRKVGVVWEEGVSNIGQKIKDVIGGAFKGVFGEAKAGLSNLSKLDGPGAKDDAAKEQERLAKIALDANKYMRESAEKLRADFEKVGQAAINVPPAIIKNIDDAFSEAISVGDFTAAQNLSNELAMLADQFNALNEFQRENLEKQKAANDMLTSRVLQMGGEVGRIVSNAMQMAEAMGPWGALLSVVMDLLYQTESFAKMLGESLKLLLKLVDLLDYLFGWIFDAVSFLLDGIGQAIDWLNDKIGNFAKTIETIGTGTIEVLPAEVPDAVDALGNAATQTATTLERLNAALTNVPAGFKTAAARFNAASPDIYNLGLGGMQDVEVNLNLDGRVIQKQMVTLNARGRYIAYGGMRPPPFWGS